MHAMSTTVAPALRALLENFIDYAGCFPPASLPVDKALANYEEYRQQDFSWMLRSFVIATGELPRVPEALDGALAVLGENDNPRAASIESKGIVTARHPVYCEVAVGDLKKLDEVKAAACFAKIRTGGIKPELIPSTAEVASFIQACAERELAFKATAGLHHPVRAGYALTYEPNAPRAIMHGFLNVLLAAAFAWHGEEDVEPILSETDPHAFKFDDRAHWRNKSLDVSQLREAREKFMHSVGSCSFEEPVHELQALGLI